jgi:hypothetical protein
VYAGVVRVFLFLHGQYLLWALGHTYGHQPYSDNHTGRNNTLLAILSLGEGYLNFHREFPSDYRMGCFYYHMDATKWFLRLLSLLRLGVCVCVCVCLCAPPCVAVMVCSQGLSLSLSLGVHVWGGRGSLWLPEDAVPTDPAGPRAAAAARA